MTRGWLRALQQNGPYLTNPVRTFRAADSSLLRCFDQIAFRAPPDTRNLAYVHLLDRLRCWGVTGLWVAPKPIAIHIGNKDLEAFAPQLRARL